MFVLNDNSFINKWHCLKGECYFLAHIHLVLQNRILLPLRNCSGTVVSHELQERDNIAILFPYYFKIYMEYFTWTFFSCKIPFTVVPSLLSNSLSCTLQRHLPDFHSYIQTFWKHNSTISNYFTWQCLDLHLARFIPTHHFISLVSYIFCIQYPFKIIYGLINWLIKTFKSVLLWLLFSY